MNTSSVADPKIAKQLAKEYFQLEGELKALDSYSDQNYRLTTAAGDQYVLKFSLSEDDQNVVMMQNNVLQHLAAKDSGLGVPRVIKAADQSDLVQLPMDDGSTVCMRVLSFLPGCLWFQVEMGSRTFFEKIGAFLGELNRFMVDFNNPHAKRFLNWDLRYAMAAFEYTTDIVDPEQRYLAQWFLTQFDATVLPLWPQLPKQIIHNDCNDYNLIVSRENGAWFPSGIIDFGDMVHTARISEPAIAAAYAVLKQDDPLTIAASLLAGYHSVNQLQPKEVEVFFQLLCTRLAVSVCMSAHRKKQEPDNAYLLVTEAPAWRALEKLRSIHPNDAIHLMFEACGFPSPSQKGGSPQILLNRRRALLGPSLSVSYRKPLKMVQGRGQYLINHEGRSYLDGVNNVCHVGHCHPKVVEAAQNQMAILNTNTRYLSDHLVDYAEALTAKFPDPLNVVFLVNSGSEANDLALRMARHFTQAKGVIALEAGYHGHLTSLIDFSHYKCAGPGGKGPAEWAAIAPLPDPYRGQFRGANTGEAYAETIKTAIAELAAKDFKPAAFFCESLPGCGGQIVLPEGYLKHAYQWVREAGGLCIADEVQVGFGRVGDCFWGFELQGVVPDIVTLGKPIGNGHPLAAVITTKEIAHAFANGMEYFNTFGGNPVSSVIGKAVLETIEQENLRGRAKETGSFLLKEFKKLQKDYPCLGDVRGHGLFMGIEIIKQPSEPLMPDPELAAELVNSMRTLGILLSVDGPEHNVIKIKPPMTFSMDNAQFLLDSLSLCLARCCS